MTQNIAEATLSMRPQNRFLDSDFTQPISVANEEVGALHEAAKLAGFDISNLASLHPGYGCLVTFKKPAN